MKVIAIKRGVYDGVVRCEGDPFTLVERSQNGKKITCEDQFSSAWMRKVQPVKAKKEVKKIKKVDD